MVFFLQMKHNVLLLHISFCMLPTAKKWLNSKIRKNKLNA